MTKQETAYLEIGRGFKDAEEGQLFGKPCFKIKGKPFVCFFENSMVFKLIGKAHAEALGLSGSHLFDPSGKKRPMKEWVQVSFTHHAKWTKFAKSALNYVLSTL